VADERRPAPQRPRQATTPGGSVTRPAIPQQPRRPASAPSRPEGASDPRIWRLAAGQHCVCMTKPPPAQSLPPRASSPSAGLLVVQWRIWPAACFISLVAKPRGEFAATFSQPAFFAGSSTGSGAGVLSAASCVLRPASFLLPPLVRRDSTRLLRGKKQGGAASHPRFRRGRRRSRQQACASSHGKH
jgi:hypothetical protein